MKKIIYSLLFFGSFLTLTGCEEAGYEELIPQEYNKILYIKNNGQKDLVLFNDGNNEKYSLTVVKSGSDPSATAQVKLSVLSQAEIDNDVRYKGNNYIVLNSECYSFRSKDIKFESSDSYKIEEFMLNPQKITEQVEAEASGNSIFILPIRLSSKTDSVNYEQRDLILKPQVKQLSIKFEKSSTLIDLGVNKEQEIVTEIKVAMVSGIINKWDFTAGMTVSTDQAEIDAYNLANQTDYKAIPSAAFTEPENLIFNIGISESVGVLVVDRSKLAKGTTYLVPLQLKQSEDLATITSDTKKHYVILKYMFDMVGDKIALDASMLRDPFGCTGENTLGALVDNNGDTFWGTKYGEASGTVEYGQAFDVHIGKSVNSIMFKYTTRSNNNATPTVIKIFTSADNGLTWNTDPLATLNKDTNGLPQASKAEYTSSTYSSQEAFNCIRFSIMESKLGICDGQHKTPDNFWVSTALSEFALWGM